MPIPLVAAAGAFLRNAANSKLASKVKEKIGEKLRAEIQPHETGWKMAAILSRWGTPPLVIATIFLFAVGAGEAGQRTGVNNPRNPGQSQPVDCQPDQVCVPPGDPPPATGNCAPLANASRLTYSYSNDRNGLPNGAIAREVEFPPEDPIGELVPVNPNICNGLIGLVINNGVSVHLTAVVNHHTRLVNGTNRISRHWTGDAIDTANIAALAQYFFEYRASLGVRQIITGQFQQYNVDRGEPVPWSHWPPGTQQAHFNHIHVGW